MPWVLLRPALRSTALAKRPPAVGLWVMAWTICEQCRAAWESSQQVLGVEVNDAEVVQGGVRAEDRDGPPVEGQALLEVLGALGRPADVVE